MAKHLLDRIVNIPTGIDRPAHIVHHDGRLLRERQHQPGVSRREAAHRHSGSAHSHTQRWRRHMDSNLER